jgi:hypothetical protein
MVIVSNLILMLLFLCGKKVTKKAADKKNTAFLSETAMGIFSTTVTSTFDLYS